MRVEERLDVRRSELALLGTSSHQVPRALLAAQRAAIRTLRGQRVVDVDDADNLREQRHLVSPQTVRIAAAIQPLVVAAG